MISNPNFNWQQLYINGWLKMLFTIPTADNLTATVEQTLIFQKKMAQSAVELQAMGIEAAITYQLIWLDNYFDILSTLLIRDSTDAQILSGG